MAKTVKKKSMPAGKNDNIRVAYTQFESNMDRTEIKVGDGREFDNDALLELLGFEKDASGVLRLPAASHEFDRDSKGNIIRMAEIKARKAAKKAAEKEEDVRGA